MGIEVDASHKVLSLIMVKLEQIRDLCYSFDNKKN